MRHREAAAPFDPTALISARGLGISRHGRDLLIDVDLDIREREIVTLIGPNGAGKTTLVRVLLGLEKPDRGVVRRRKDLRIGYVPQRFDSDAVIPMTVERFLMLGCSESAEPRRRHPRRMSTQATCATSSSASCRAASCSACVLARALLRKPNLLVLDEPVQGVDYTGEADLYNLIGRLRDEARLRRAARLARPAHRHGALAIASSASTITSAARACRRRWRSIRRTGGCSVRKRRAPSPSIVTTTITATTSPACRIPRTAMRRRPGARSPARRQVVLEPFFVRALVASLGLAAVAAPLGCFVVWQRMAYFGETVAQAGLIGVALGLALQMDVTWGVLIVALAVAALLFWFGRQKLVALDSILGLLHHAALAAGVIATSMIKGAPVDLTGFLFGDVFAVTSTDVAIIFIGGAAVLAVVAWLWQPLLRLAVHEELAAAEGVDRETGADRVHRAARRHHRRRHEDRRHPAGHGLPGGAGRRRPPADTHARAHGRVNRPDRRRQRHCRSVAVGHSRQPRRTVDRHRDVGHWPGFR